MFLLGQELLYSILAVFPSTRTLDSLPIRVVLVSEPIFSGKVDHDGSNCVDFEEFTVMMSAVKKGKASLGWGRINK